MPTKTSDRRRSNIVMIVAVSFFVAVLTAGFLITTSLVWEFEFEGYFSSPWLRAAIQTGYSIGLLLFLGPLALWWKSQPLRRSFRSLAFAAVYSAILSLSRLGGITDAQMAALLQIGLSLVFLALLIIISHHRQVNLKQWLLPSSRAQWMLPLIFTGVYTLTWAGIGALGSWIDTLLNLLAGLCFGLTTGVLLRLGVYTGDALNPEDQGQFKIQGFTASAVLAVMLAGMAPNGLQYLLVFVIPAIGWLLPLLTTGATFTTRVRSGFSSALTLALAVAIPFILVDPDELALVITASKGELLGWVALASLVSLFVVVIAFCILFVFRSRLPDWDASKRSNAFTLLLWVGVVMLSLFHAGPNFYGERLFVILKDQADVSQAEQIEDYDARRSFVYQTLTSHALDTQADLRQTLTDYNIRYRSYYLVNSLEVTGGPFIRLWLESRPEVDRVLDNPILRPLPVALPIAKGEIDTPPEEPEWNLVMIKASRVWQEFGVTGSGIVIGQSDSGADGTHPEFSDRYRGVREVDDYNWFDPWNGTTFPTDIGGHGTHTLATALGSHVGVAPGASWIGCVNLARNLGNPAHYLDCMQFMLAPFPQDGDPFTQGEPTRSAHVMTNSWGCPAVEGCDAGVFLPAFKALKAAGIFVVVGAGNNGDVGCGSVTDPPAIYSQNLTVGAVDENSALASFSAKGPVTFDGQVIIKPDLLAPGVEVISAFPGGTYQIESGTSMATPHVAGAVALLWSANPHLIGDIDRTMQILEETADYLQYTSLTGNCGDTSAVPNNLGGYGLLDVYSAVRRAINEK
ncbi:MAG: S8 family serine peptidase [Anaerolineaceae bacterium]